MLPDLWEAAACVDGASSAAIQAAAGRVSLVGLFDGHAGDAAARFCAQRLPGRVAARLLGELASASAAAAPAAPATAPATVTAATVRAALDEGNAAGRALRAAFLDVEAELAARHAEGLIDGSGSTAVVALITEAAAWVAHAGDSRAVLARGATVVAATDDHRPAREDERARVEAAGGLFLRNGGLRLMGVLATTRGFGDPDLAGYGLTADPEIARLPRGRPQRGGGGDDGSGDGSGGERLILGTDGLFDAVTADEAARFAACAAARVEAAAGAAADGDSGSGGGGGAGGGCCQGCKAARVAARAMAHCARARGSRDDTTVVVVDLSGRANGGAGCAAGWLTPPPRGDAAAAASADDGHGHDQECCKRAKVGGAAAAAASTTATVGAAVAAAAAAPVHASPSPSANPAPPPLPAATTAAAAYCLDAASPFASFCGLGGAASPLVRGGSGASAAGAGVGAVTIGAPFSTRSSGRSCGLQEGALAGAGVSAAVAIAVSAPPLASAELFERPRAASAGCCW